MSEFNLSERISWKGVDDIFYHDRKDDKYPLGDCLQIEDVKEFIRLLKEKLKKDIPFFRMTAKEIFEKWKQEMIKHPEIEPPSNEIFELEFRKCVRDSQDRRVAGDYAEYLLKEIDDLAGEKLK